MYVYLTEINLLYEKIKGDFTSIDQMLSEEKTKEETSKTVSSFKEEVEREKLFLRK